ncbi:hypothetical protein [Veillonella sp. R32]|uniref:hypothetical protein n=1 Tax=Veillonella sp. R32 TaxID=2021312 RepID=UPI00138A0EC6|nr:hypothetical protein [Veillonella sp. R32]KAF1682066.1 hypothetical protein VER_06845 [Veillonella sp. R32]
MIKETIIEMISSYFKIDESKFMSVVNNIEGLNVNSLEDVKNLDSAQLQTLLESLKDAYGEVSGNEDLKAGLSNLAGKFFK